MWVLLAVLAAVTSGVSVIFQKKGTAGEKILQISALNSVAMLAVMLLVCVAGGGYTQLQAITWNCWLLTIASGVVQAASWLTYFMAMRDANVSFLMVLDKVNIIVTLLLAWLLVGECITGIMLAGSLLIILGTLLMAEIEGGIRNVFKGSNHWILWGILSPTLQAVANIIVKLDTTRVDTTLTTTIRTFIVTVVLLAAARLKDGPLSAIKELGVSRIACLITGGILLGVSYILMYRSIYLGIAAVVAPIVKSGFLITTLLAFAMLGERLTKRGRWGFPVVCAGVALFLI